MEPLIKLAIAVGMPHHTAGSSGWQGKIGKGDRVKASGWLAS
ncbi:MAG: hypothetical protein VKJ24_08710 [Synechococcales bacterium]|nr:hypothetical protein [Synechococcales bacterium]